MPKKKPKTARPNKRTPPGAVYSDLLSFRPKALPTRQQIITQAVISLIASRGIDEVTFESVGKKAKMARSHVVYYFRDRESLIDGALAYVVESAQRMIAASLLELGNFEELLVGYIDANFNWLEQNPEHRSVMLLLYYESLVNRKRRAFHSAIREVGRKRIEAILKTHPEIRFGADLIPLSRDIQALISGHLLDAFTTEGGDVARARRQCFATSLRLVGTYQ